MSLSRFNGTVFTSIYAGLSMQDSLSFTERSFRRPILWYPHRDLQNVLGYHYVTYILRTSWKCQFLFGHINFTPRLAWPFPLLTRTTHSNSDLNPRWHINPVFHHFVGTKVYDQYTDHGRLALGIYPLRCTEQWDEYCHRSCPRS